MLYPIELLRQMTASMVTARPLFVMSRVGFLTVRHTPHSRECGVTVRPDALYLRVLRTRKQSIRRDTSSVGASLLANDLREQARSHRGGLSWSRVFTGAYSQKNVYKTSHNGALKLSTQVFCIKK